MKKISTLVLSLIFLLLFSGCTATEQSETTTPLTESPVTSAEPVFRTENIKRITFFAYYGTGKGSDVPDKHMTEVINWLETFSIDKEADEMLPPGVNTYYVEIEYLDGTIVKKGLDVITVDGISYYVKHASLPDYLEEILSDAIAE